MTAPTAQTFLDQGYDDNGKGSRLKAPERVSSHPNAMIIKIRGSPNLAKVASSYQGWQKHGRWTDYNKPKQGKDTGHHSRTNRKKDDDQDNHDSWCSR